MFLKNFWDMLRVAYSNPVFNDDGGYNARCTKTAIKGLDGTDFEYIVNSSNTNSGCVDNKTVKRAQNAIRSPYSGYTAIVGSGDSAVSVDDYALETDCTSSFSNTTTSTALSVNANGSLTVTITWSGTNLSGSDIVIKEFGCTKGLVKYNASSMYCNSSQSPDIALTQCLILRKLLSSPVTVPSGSGATITVSITVA